MQTLPEAITHFMKAEPDLNLSSGFNSWHPAGLLSAHASGNHHRYECRGRDIVEVDNDGTVHVIYRACAR